MIHYMLLPRDEMKILRREYRVRLSIIAIFFISCAIIAGMIALLPSFVNVQSQKRALLTTFEELKKSQKENGADELERILIESQAIAQKILETENKVMYSDAIQKVIARRPAQVVISFFEASRAGTSATTTLMSVQGTAASREALLEFKKRLESDSAFEKVELPLSDLAKSKNVSFTVKLVLAHN